MASHETTVVLTGLQPGLTYTFEVAILPLPVSAISDCHFYYRLKQVQVLDSVKGLQFRTSCKIELMVTTYILCDPSYIEIVLFCHVAVTETGSDDHTTAAIAVVSVIAGIAVIVLVVMVARCIWRHIRGSKRLKL